MLSVVEVAASFRARSHCDAAASESSPDPQLERKQILQQPVQSKSQAVSNDKQRAAPHWAGEFDSE